MSRYIDGECRDQATLLPQRIDDYIGEDNPVRAIDAFVDELDLEALGFARAIPAATGRPAYHPATLLKLYIYGYLNRIQSSRRLEREAGRNLELIWLLERLAPDFKTIADFRRDNGKPIQRVCSEFIELCRQLRLLADGVIAIDGSKFKAVNNRDKNLTKHKLRSRMEHLEKSVAVYLDAMNRADKAGEADAPERIKNLKHKVATIRAHMRELLATGDKLKDTPDQQISITDPDARSMTSQGRGTGMVGYNVQTAVESKHHLIVAHHVTNAASDRAQLKAMADRAIDATGRQTPTVLADRGYYSGKEILACEEAGIQTLVPKPLTSGSRKHGRFDKRDFTYHADKDEYECPAGERAIFRFPSHEKGMVIKKYWASACIGCKIKAQCTTSDYRRIGRWEHEAHLEAMQKRLEATPDASRLRRQTVEHPFATIKHRMGTAHLLMKRLPNVSTEMSLHVLAYNLTRVLNIMGTKALIGAIRAV